MLGRTILFVVSLALSVAAVPVAVPVAVTSVDDAVTIAAPEVARDGVKLRVKTKPEGFNRRSAAEDAATLAQVEVARGFRLPKTSQGNGDKRDLGTESFLRRAIIRVGSHSGGTGGLKGRGTKLAASGDGGREGFNRRSAAEDEATMAPVVARDVKLRIGDTTKKEGRNVKSAAEDAATMAPVAARIEERRIKYNKPKVDQRDVVEERSFKFGVGNTPKVGPGKRSFKFGVGTTPKVGPGKRSFKFGVGTTPKVGPGKRSFKFGVGNTPKVGPGK